MKRKSKNDMLNEKERSHFEDIEKEMICKDLGHNPPSHVHIPQGKRYIHVCPSCGNRIVITPQQISFVVDEKNPLKYDFIAALKKQMDTQFPIKKGCSNVQCFCTGECQKIIGWRDKTSLEISRDHINRIRR